MVPLVSSKCGVGSAVVVVIIMLGAWLSLVIWVPNVIISMVGGYLCLLRFAKFVFG